MAQLASSVGHQLIQVDYDNNKHVDDSSSPVGHDGLHVEPVAVSASPGCLLDLYPNDFQLADCPVPVCLSEEPVDASQTAADDDSTTRTQCSRCGLHLHHHRHQLHHWHQQQHPQQQPHQSLVYGQLCVAADGPTCTNDRYPVGLRTPH